MVSLSLLPSSFCYTTPFRHIVLLLIFRYLQTLPTYPRFSISFSFSFYCRFVRVTFLLYFLDDSIQNFLSCAGACMRCCLRLWSRRNGEWQRKTNRLTYPNRMPRRQRRNNAHRNSSRKCTSYITHRHTTAHHVQRECTSTLRIEWAKKILNWKIDE